MTEILIFLIFFPCQTLFFCSGQESFDERGILLIGCGVYLKKSHLRIEYDIRSELMLSNEYAGIWTEKAFEGELTSRHTGGIS